MSVPKLQLVDYYYLAGSLLCESGLHIGAGNERIEIGGVDRTVIVHPVDHTPYIPGSSLKGRLRSLLEVRHAAFDLESGEPGKLQSGNSGFVGRIFGVSAGDGKGNVAFQPTGLIVRDARPSDQYAAELKERRRSGLPIFEQKTENSINRIDASANPRTIERVPAGATFDFAAVYRIFALAGDASQSRRDFDYVLQALALLELDSLGGHGSRGYGRVKFANLTCHNLKGEPVTLKASLRDYLPLLAGA